MACWNNRTFIIYRWFAYVLKPPLMLALCIDDFHKDFPATFLKCGTFPSFLPWLEINISEPWRTSTKASVASRSRGIWRACALGSALIRALKQCASRTWNTWPSAGATWQFDRTPRAIFYVLRNMATMALDGDGSVAKSVLLQQKLAEATFEPFENEARQIHGTKQRNQLYAGLQHH